MQKPYSEKGMVYWGSDLSGMRFWLRLSDEPPKLAKVIAEGNLEWIVEEKGNEVSRSPRPT